MSKTILRMAGQTCARRVNTAEVLYILHSPMCDSSHNRPSVCIYMSQSNILPLSNISIYKTCAKVLYITLNSIICRERYVDNNE